MPGSSIFSPNYFLDSWIRDGDHRNHGNSMFWMHIFIQHLYPRNYFNIFTPHTPFALSPDPMFGTATVFCWQREYLEYPWIAVSLILRNVFITHKVSQYRVQRKQQAIKIQTSKVYVSTVYFNSYIWIYLLDLTCLAVRGGTWLEQSTE